MLNVSCDETVRERLYQSVTSSGVTQDYRLHVNSWVSQAYSFFMSNNNGILHALSKDVNNWAAQVYMYRLSVKSGVSQVCRLSVSS